MEVVIKKNSTPKLIVDPREFGDGNVNWDEVLTNAVVTFSLFDVETGCFVIASGAAEIIPGGLSANDSALTNSVACGDNTEVTRVGYKFRARDVKRAGVFKATFQVNVIGEETVLAVPEMSDIQVVIVESGIQPYNGNVYTGLPEIPIIPSGSTGDYSGTTLISGTWAELNTLRVNSTLIPGQKYVVLDYQTIHRIPGSNTINTGPYEPLIIESISQNKFSSVAASTVNNSDIIHYDFSNEYVKCEDSFDADTVIGAACVNLNSIHRPGYIYFREDSLSNRSSHYDFRSYINSVNGITGYTFGAETSGKIGKNSGNILLRDGVKNVEIGDSSHSILLTKIANRIKIGNDVKGFNFSGLTIANTVSAKAYFELGDYGIKGFSRVLLSPGKGFSLTPMPIGVLPANNMVYNVELVSKGLVAANDAKLSLGVSGLDNGEIFSEMSLSGVASGLFNAQTTTRILANDSYINATFTKLPTLGMLVVVVSFVNISA